VAKSRIGLHFQNCGFVKEKLDLGRSFLSSRFIQVLNSTYFNKKQVIENEAKIGKKILAVQQMEAERHFGQSSRQVANIIVLSIEYVYTRYEVFMSVYMKTAALWIV